jgi:NADPH-dependent 2,4-dienoyl-CoA reductase/sulfur reductase-like enzyme
VDLSKTRVVIVGAGQTGGRAAEALRAGHLGSITAARNNAGEANDYEAPPWFWSDQDDANIQIVGHPGGDAEIVRGDIANGPFTTLSIRDNEVVGGIAGNAARDTSVPRRPSDAAKDDPQKRSRKSDFELKRSLLS